MITIRDKVRFVETDMMGVVHHANYLRWFEMGRVAYLRACGITLGELMEAGVIFPITEVRAQYKNSCTFDDDFEVQVEMSGFNKAKMEFDYRVIRLRDGAVAVEGHTRRQNLCQPARMKLLAAQRAALRNRNNAFSSANNIIRTNLVLRIFQNRIADIIVVRQNSCRYRNYLILFHTLTSPSQPYLPHKPCKFYHTIWAPDE